MIQSEEDKLLKDRLMTAVLNNPMSKVKLAREIGIAYVTLHNLMFGKRSTQFSSRLKIEAYCMKLEEGKKDLACQR